MKNLKAFTLAQGATETDVLSSQTCHPELVSGSNSNQMLKQVQHDRLFKRAGFTLAEVLITLGIIGVVAAMTIPTLVSNYQKRAWTAQLQKSYAVMNQGFRRMLADEGVDLLSQTDAFQSIDGNGCFYGDNPDSAQCNDFLINLGDYFKIVDIKKFEASDNYKTYYLNGSSMHNPYTQNAILLSDGTMIIEYDFHTSAVGHKDNQMQGNMGYFYIDLNGTSRPNKLGRDIFMFFIDNNGMVYPAASMAAAKMINPNDFNAYYWKTATHPDYTCKEDGKSYGTGCAGRVLETGNMDYPYENNDNY